MRFLWAFIVVSMLAAPAAAQELPKATRYQGYDWYTCNFLRFHPDGLEEGTRIIRDHFYKVDRRIERKVVVLFFDTGEWSHIACFPVAGPEVFSYATAPHWEKWWQALAVQEGGPKQALELWSRFQSLVAEQRTELSRRLR